ncbi:MAG: hypothetical protein SOH45_01750, partial [Oscillospiraceae bacterium]
SPTRQRLQAPARDFYKTLFHNFSPLSQAASPTRQCLQAPARDFYYTFTIFLPIFYKAIFYKETAVGFQKPSAAFCIEIS